MQTTQPVPLMDADELADYLGVTRRTLLEWNLDGRGPKRIRIGRKNYYRVTDVQAWINAQETL